MMNRFYIYIYDDFFLVYYYILYVYLKLNFNKIMRDYFLLNEDKSDEKLI